MKKLHLLCNAHLDPAWLWRWNEGLAEAISTFRVAADFCEKYDGFIFNHNEALLYEWVEEHEPQLFERIKKLVKKGSWRIMGGWYLQPDCVMTSGESLIEQIKLGNEYFMEKFGIKPTVSINFDSFGHTRGLVQILKNFGYEGYIFKRPEEFKGSFLWEGYDGSKIKAHCMIGHYGTSKGMALEWLRECMTRMNDDTCLFLWGIGNHGGGPSKIDLENLNEFIKESDIKIIHSSAEGFMAEVPEKNLPVRAESLVPCMIGCYTSMVRVKQANRRVENKIAMTDKIMSYVEMQSDYKFDRSEFKKAKKALAFCQFHDILPGSAIKGVETDSLRTLDYAEEIAEKLYTKAFFKLCEGQKKAVDGEIPVLVFNPHPYEVEGEFEVEFMLQNQNWNIDEITCAYVYDEDGNELPTQNEKPSCTFNLDWTDKISFKGKLAPSSITRFDCKLKVEKRKSIPQDGEYITVENEHMTAKISKFTGLIDLYKVDGKTLIENSGKLNVYKDNEDPWGMTVDSFKDKIGEFTLMTDAEANEFIGYKDEKLPNVRIIEDGAVRTKIQAFFSYKRSVAVVEYTLPKLGKYIDVNITVYSNEVNNMIKYVIDTQTSGTPLGQSAFGRENMFSDERESVFHKWCGIENGVYVLNDGTYGGSFTKNSIKLSLLRTPIYSAHPLGDRQIAPHNRFTDHMDMGERRFSFRITTGEDIERKAQIFNEKPWLLSFFPSGDGMKKNTAVKIDNPDVILSSVRTENGKYILTAYNSSDKEAKAEIRCIQKDEKIKTAFGKYEIKTIEI